MLSLLDATVPYISNNDFYGIRISTRPDKIDNEVLSVLKKYGVTSIELGAQSMCDDVLIANNRGHNSEDVINASQLIKEYNFSLGLQMMTGLYKSDYQKDIYTAHKIADLKPDTVRIYPTVIMENTELGNLFKSGKYNSLTFEETVDLCAELIIFFESRNIDIIRLGLHESESLKNDMIGGVYHPAFKEICENRIFLKKAVSILDNNINSDTVKFIVSPKSISKFKGQKKYNINYLERKYNIKILTDLDNTLGKYDIYIK